MMMLNQETIEEIINCFVKIYGEDCRIEISNKINNCLVLLCGYKDENQLQKLYDDISQKYSKVLHDKVLKLIKLSEDDFQYLFGNNILSDDSQIAAFGSTSQGIVDKTPKTGANKINTRQILNIRNAFYDKSDIKDISIDLADKLINIYDEIESLAKNEFRSSSLNYEENMQTLNQMKFLEKPNFDIEFYDFEQQQHNGVQPNFIKDKNSNIRLYPIINFATVKKQVDRIFGAPDYFDVLLIHEINHIIGMHLKEYRAYGDYTIQMGMLISDTGKNTTKYYKESMIDEIFNQRIAKKVTNLLHEKGIYLIDNSNKSQVNDSSLYEMAEFILDEFFNMFEKELLDIYRTGNGLDRFYEEIGIENANELGELINKYLNNPDILDITEEENQKYKQDANRILNKIKYRVENSDKNKLISDLNIALCVLDINDLNNLDEMAALNAYKNTLLKYGIASDEYDNDYLNQIKQAITDSYNLIISNLNVVKSEKDIVTNSKYEKLYGVKKKNIFGNSNIISSESTNILITNLFENGVSPTDIIRYLNLLEYGMVTGSGTRKMIDSFGEKVCNILFNISDSGDEAFNLNTYQELMNKINQINGITKSGIRKN